MESELSWDGISSFRVTLTAGDTGDEENPVSSLTGAPFDLEARAVSGMGDEIAWSGTAQLSVLPGELGDTADQTIELVDGVGTASVLVRRAFGPTRIWVEDLGTPEAPGSIATGLSDVIWFAGVSIRDVQESSSTVSSPLEGERVTIKQGHLVVTHVAGDGFFVTDTDESEWSSIYAYNYSRPGGLERGDVLGELAGSIQEYYGFTELNNPSWAEIGIDAVPAAYELDCQADVDPGGLAMERWESALVRASGGTIRICNTYPTCGDYTQYNQWMIELPCGGRLNVISNAALPDFDPLASHGQTIDHIRGVLRHHRYASPAWILTPRDAKDLCCPSCVPARTDGC